MDQYKPLQTNPTSVPVLAFKRLDGQAEQQIWSQR
ncbi:hypothetical protein SAMN04490190_3823 [Pseudomonas libanensis]|nr:hypothetical protein SAMN04490190_3823 [Pseudomonas libanensis]